MAKKNVNIYFRCLYVGKGLDAVAITLGATTDSGATFYGEMPNNYQIITDNWKEEYGKIFKFFTPDMMEEVMLKNKFIMETYEEFVRGDINVECLGNKWTVGDAFYKWLETNFKSVNLVLVSDMGYYDYVLLNEIIGKSLKVMPKTLSIQTCMHDINCDIAAYLKKTEIDAASVDRINFLHEHNIDINSCDALSQATIVKEIYQICRKKGK